MNPRAKLKAVFGNWLLLGHRTRVLGHSIAHENRVVNTVDRWPQFGITLCCFTDVFITICVMSSALHLIQGAWFGFFPITKPLRVSIKHHYFCKGNRAKASTSCLEEGEWGWLFLEALWTRQNLVHCFLECVYVWVLWRSVQMVTRLLQKQQLRLS